MDDDRDGLAWDWTPDLWSWSPVEGRWSPKHGLPKDPVHFELSTDAAPPREAYDFWRQIVFYDFAADRRKDDDPSGFRARAQGLVSDAAEFYVYESGSVSGRRTAAQLRADGSDDLTVGLVVSGRRNHEEGDTAGVAGPGDFFLYDAARPSRVVWQAHRGMHLKLDRSVAESALGGTTPASGDVARMLSTSRLAPFLRSQLTLLAQHMGGLSGAERLYLLDQTVRLVIFALQGQAGRERASEPELARQALFAAAQRYIDRHFADPELSVAALADALGCSRTTLFRAFADHGLTVSGAIREVRLAGVRRIMDEAPPHLTIGEIAARCGFVDRRTFNRVFRDHFGVRPTELLKR